MSTIKSAVTLSLVPEARGGPFVFWNGIEDACEQAARLGFDALEIFPPGAEIFGELDVSGVLARHGLAVAAVGSGAGWVKHKLRLTDADSSIRKQAVEFASALLSEAARLGAPLIIGSMQGRWENGINRGAALEFLAQGMGELDRLAHELGTRVLIEPLNRYETNLLNTVADGVGFIQMAGLRSTRVLCDLFHMNIEEQDTCAALRSAGALLGHVHFADTNRRAMGMGQADVGLIARTLRQMEYEGYVSAEVLPLPGPEVAAERTAAQFRAFFRTT